MIAALLDHLPAGPGFFVEAGAADGLSESTSLRLERERGWHGLLVEPVPELHAACRRNRPGARVVHGALVPADFGGATVPVRTAGLMSLVPGARGSAQADEAHLELARYLGAGPSERVEVPARTLSGLLDEIGSPPVDLLSLDLEGYEPQALRGLDLERHRPAHVLVEVLEPEPGRRRVEAVLGRSYELLAMLTGRDALYRVRSESADVPGPDARLHAPSRAADGEADDAPRPSSELVEATAILPGGPGVLARDAMPLRPRS